MKRILCLCLTLFVLFCSASCAPTESETPGVTPPPPTASPEEEPKNESTLEKAEKVALATVLFVKDKTLCAIDTETEKVYELAEGYESSYAGGIAFDYATVSPDGKTVYYYGNFQGTQRDLFSCRLGEEPILIAKQVKEFHLSEDGSTLCYRNTRDQLFLQTKDETVKSPETCEYFLRLADGGERCLFAYFDKQLGRERYFLQSMDGCEEIVLEGRVVGDRLNAAYTSPTLSDAYFLTFDPVNPMNYHKDGYRLYHYRAGEGLTAVSLHMRDVHFFSDGAYLYTEYKTGGVSSLSTVVTDRLSESDRTAGESDAKNRRDSQRAEIRDYGAFDLYHYTTFFVDGETTTPLEGQFIAAAADAHVFLCKKKPEELPKIELSDYPDASASALYSVWSTLYTKSHPVTLYKDLTKVADLPLGVLNSTYDKPQISDDGTKVAFLAARQSETDEYDMYLLDTKKGTQARNLSKGATPSAFYSLVEGHLDWSLSFDGEHFLNYFDDYEIGEAALGDQTPICFADGDEVFFRKGGAKNPNEYGYRYTTDLYLFDQTTREETLLFKDCLQELCPSQKKQVVLADFDFETGVGNLSLREDGEIRTLVEGVSQLFYTL
ncbi:MAG: hypothetical protein IJF24_02045 [Clostridia bacterium]|nr:hypothetical protein [Clostridia bacterium]